MFYAGIATSPLTKAKRRKKYAPSAKEKVSVAEFLMQLTESPPAPRREGGMWRKRGSKDVASECSSTGVRVFVQLVYEPALIAFTCMVTMVASGKM